MNPFIDLLGDKLHRIQMELEFFAKGGAKLHHVLQKLLKARDFDIMVLMVVVMTCLLELVNTTLKGTIVS